MKNTSSAQRLTPEPSLHLVKAPGAEKLDGYLLGPVVDPLLMGGASIVFFLGMHFFVEPTASTYRLSWTMFYLSFAVNFPHFMASYVLMYKDHRREIFTSWKFTWAAVVAPALLLCALAGLAASAIAEGNSAVLGHLPNLMFFLVGHHYVKQTYGCVMVSSAKAKFYFSALESRVLWLCMHAVWMMSFVSFNSYAGAQAFYGITYSTLGLGPHWQKVAYAATAASLFGFLGLMARRYVADGRVMPVSAWTAVATILVWYIPTLNHAHYFYMIPLFHSLQYLLFSSVFAKNKARDLAGAFEEGPPRRRAFLRHLGTFFFLAALSGALAWSWIPTYLDGKALAPAVLGPTFFMFSFQIFLNIHHYLMDNVLWRKDNPQIRKYL